ncbi:MAG TPA: isoprenylcysteine carboxylmethyltransferase family protein [bacterium]|nr:isoprenylcysteine carboxylmethyltransferase family protein [bacterium]
MRDGPARRTLAALGSVVFLVIAPGTVAGLVPWWISRWRVHASLVHFPLLRVIGSLLIIAGVIVLVDSFARFAFQGVGTPAPVFPPRHFVASGLYRYVRNPMYVATVSAIVGQGVFFGDPRLLAYGALTWFIFHVFVLAYEEPKLRATFGTEYNSYRAHVPRWLPRLRPWRGGTGQ